MSYSIVVIDDETKICSGICNLFPWDSWGFFVANSFCNSLEAAEYLQHNHIDVVLCDITMPILDGLELAKQVWETDRAAHFVLISGYRNFDYAQKAVRLKCVDAYVTKPIDMHELSVIMQRLKKELDETCSEPKPLSRIPSAGFSVTPESVDEGENPNGGHYYQKLVAQIKKIVNEDYATVTLETVASRLGLSCGHISRIFKQYEGEAFSEYVLRQKLKQAKILLDDISLKCYEIAERVGYDDPRSFSRAFKNYYGFSPFAYRKSSENEDPCL